MTSRPAGPPGAAPSPWPVLLGVGGLCLGVELALWAADLGWVGSRRWRGVAVENTGFWTGLLRNWRPNWPGQGAAMFVTYAFLHAGPTHMLGNLGALAWLGPPVARAVGSARFLLAWALCAAAGGAAFAGLADTPVPMVGASGALFGLLGMDAALRHRAAPSRMRLLGVVAAFVALNLASLVLQGGRLAWQAHLGGFLMGLVLGTALRAVPERVLAR